MDMGPNAEYVYEHSSYNALIEQHMRACGEQAFDPKASPLCLYLTSRLSAANWMIIEGESGETVIKFVEESTQSAPPIADYYRE